MPLDLCLEPTTAHIRRTGDGDAVVCLHASGCSSSQWKPLMEHLADRYRMLAVDLYGSGKTPPWPGERPLRLADEVALLGPAFQAAGGKVHLVGHSYGGAVALKAALARPGRVRSLVLFEPVFLSLLLAEDPQQPAAQEITDTRRAMFVAAQRGDLEASAARFIDYWGGAGSWSQVPESRRGAAARTMDAVNAEWEALVAEPAPLSAFAALQVPILLLVGTQSPASSRGVARLLAKTLPRVTVGAIQGVGHMGPITHAERINTAIEAHLDNFAR